MNESILELMRQFNFSAAAASTYSLLLTDGPLSVEQLEQRTQQNGTRLEQALKKLQELRLIGTDHQRGHPLYYATDPAMAWLSLTADLVWEKRNTLNTISNLPETNSPDTEHLRMLCAEISAHAERLYKPQVAALKHRERDAESSEELAQFTCEIIYQARKEIFAVSKTPRQPQVSSFWAVLSSLIENKSIHYHRVVDLEEVIEHGLKIVERDMGTYGIDLCILEQDQIQHTFYLVDKRFLSVLNKSSQPPDKPELGYGRITNQYQIIARYRKRYERYKEASIPGLFVVNHMRQATEKLLETANSKLPAIEVLWLKSLVDFGKFSKFHVENGWSVEYQLLVEEKATALGLTRRSADGYLVPIYPTSETALRSAYLSI